MRRILNTTLGLALWAMTFSLGATPRTRGIESNLPRCTESAPVKCESDSVRREEPIALRHLESAREPRAQLQPLADEDTNARRAEKIAASIPTPDEDKKLGYMVGSGMRPTIIPSAQSGAVALPGGRLAVDVETGRDESIEFIAVPLHASGIRPQKTGYPSFSSYFLGQKRDGAYLYAKSFWGFPGVGWRSRGNHLAVSLDPRFGNMPSRVRSEQDCAPRGDGTLEDRPIFSPTGVYECFRVVIVVGLSSEKSGDLRLFHSTATIVTKAFATNGGRILEPNRPQVVLAKLTSSLTRLRDDSGHEVFAFEPTMTADSRLLLAQVLQGRGGPGHAFMFSEKPWLPTGWSSPVEIARMYHYRDRAFCSSPGMSMAACPEQHRSTLGREYPILSGPFRDFEGKPISEKMPHIFGYPWIDFDGRNVFFQAVRRSAFSVAGIDTNHRIYQVDGSPNLIRDYQRPGASPTPCEPQDFKLCKGLTRTFAPGSSSGFWGIYPDAPRLLFPFTQRTPVHFMFHVTPSLQGQGVSSFGEITLHDSIDPDFLVSLRMNEPVTVRPHYKYNKIFSGFDLLTDRVADSSGNGHTAYLRGGAAFPQEYTKRDTLETANPGYVGRAVYFPAGGTAVIKATEKIALPLHRATVEIAVKLLSPLRQQVRIVEKARSWALVIGDDGAPRVSLFIGGVEYASGPLGGRLKDGQWYHLSFSYRARGKRRFAFYVDGHDPSKKSDEQIRFQRRGASRRVGGNLPPVGVDSFGLPEGPLDGNREEIVLGPRADIKDARALYLLDEFALSRVARPPSYAAAAGYAQHYIPGIDEDVGRRFPIKLPRGLSRADLKLPLAISNLIDRGEFVATARIGEMLFKDPNLSRDDRGVSQGISCASCHIPQRGFADNRRVSQGVNNKLGSRNVPTIVNRALATSHMLDGRTTSLVAQALLPLSNENEMNSDLDQVADYLLNPENGYLSELERIFAIESGGDALPEDRRSRVLRALAICLAAFESTIFAGDSEIDRINAGVISAPNERVLRGMQLFNGKARCIACHTGSNYTDDLPHVTGTADKADRGRGKITGLTSDIGAFKTPTLRQLSKTGPYFHNGSAPDLEAVIDFYDRGGAETLNLDPEMRPLHLTAQEKTDLVQFLRALTSRVVSGVQKN